MYIIQDERVFRYSFRDHPFSSEKARKATQILVSEGIVKPIRAREYPEDILYLFHDRNYVEFVKEKSKEGRGYLLEKGIKPLLYVDIDAHHGDGVFYGFIDNRDVYIIDYHEDPRTLFPGTGYEYETGEGEAKGTKRNVVREMFSTEIDRGEFDQFIAGKNFKFILMQIGADGLAGDPLTHLRYGIDSYRKIIKRVHTISRDMCEGRLVLLGGGGYSLQNAVEAYTSAIKGLRQ